MIKRLSIQALIKQAATVGITVAIGLLTTSEAGASSDADYSFLIESDWHSCQQINPEYQAVYAFETPSYLVNICQKDNVYFYSGSAKQRDVNSIFIPATPLEHNRGFKANNGNVSYVVILPFVEPATAIDSPLAPEEAILTIKRNDLLVSVESSLNKYCHQSEAIALDDLKLNPLNVNQLAAITQEQDFSSELLINSTNELLPLEIFDLNARFDFYRIDGKLHRLSTCS